MAAGAMVSGHAFSADLLERINTEVRPHPELNRSALSRRVCDWLDWKGPEGAPKQVSCRVALLGLHRRGLIELPEAQGEVPRAPKRGAELKDPVDQAEGLWLSKSTALP
jgi:hypothetical protein